MKIKLLVAATAALCFAQMGTAQAQPMGEWTFEDNGSEAYAEVYESNEFSGDFGWQFRVIRTSSMGIALDSLSFEMSIILHADILDPAYRRFEGRSFARNVVLTTNDGASFRPATATFRMGDQANSAFLDISFTPMEDDDGVLDLGEPNCRVIAALRRASSFTMSFPTPEGGYEVYEFSGRGSSRALSALGACD